MLRAAGRDYVCWRCLRHSAPAVRRAAQRGLSVSAAHRQQPIQPVPSVSPDDPFFEDFGPAHGTPRIYGKAKIRDKLRIWEAENPASPLTAPDRQVSSGLANIANYALVEHGFRSDGDEADDMVQTLTDTDAGLSPNTSTIEAGDLIEIGLQSRSIPTLALCLGKFNGYDHFYTNSGQWFTTPGLQARFIVKRFIRDRDELLPVINALPSVEGSGDVLKQLRELHAGPPRSVCAPIIQKILQFQDDARTVQQKYIEKLSQAHDVLGPSEKMLTLNEAAEALYPASLKRNKASFTPEERYAVHTILCAQDLAFRPLLRARHDDNSVMFAMASKVDVMATATAELAVREYLEYLDLPETQGDKVARKMSSRAAFFHTFVLQARKAIDESRKARDWTPYGMIGPAKRRSPQPLSSWPQLGRIIIHFMQLWSAGNQLPSSSRLHWLGSAVLRAIGRYDDAMYIDATVGWTFLQEIGWITPWEIQARFGLRLPGVQLRRSGGLLPWPNDSKAAELEADQLAPLRQDFGASTVYCIDSQSTTDVDDGVSIEKAGDGEYWIHIHVADPASRIKPKSWLAARAARIPQTIYLKGHFDRMFYDDIVRETFSLSPGRPSLTFSAKVTETGNILDHKITPGIVQDVVYITPEDASAVVGEEDTVPVPSDVFEVGTPPTQGEFPSRTMTKPEDLSQQQREELQLLGKLATALHKKRLQKGAVPAYLSRPKVDVSFQGMRVAIQPDTNFIETQGDPYIRVSYESGGGSNLVGSLMQLAGQVAAQWCYERDIPIPYRIQALSQRNEAALRAFTYDVLYPQLEAGKRPTAEQYRQLQALTGGQDISTTPTLNFLMGLDMYAKATSPLRRFADLLLHWQVEAALLEEHRTGKSLVLKERAGRTTPLPTTLSDPPKRNSFLPFSRTDLETRIFPQLRTREQHGKLLDNVDGTNEWILQALVRAWAFGQGKEGQLPKTFKFTVSEVDPRQTIRGTLDWFDRRAIMEPEGFNDVVRPRDVKVGDVLTVELARVNAHMRKIFVKALSVESAEAV
ncbi:hypothetical protein B0T16DRAFT_399189 [Cercophora newfieldiana]|uniref:RNB domain-containing protein n=1 Tax=Cercophora newfieldiana TaxID=92897 RepID=A0AA40D122_9PEZI|nr:hypothetical protein B0T16DRAFT_399189 [Cercophora newfieldiana]